MPLDPQHQHRLQQQLTRLRRLVADHAAAAARPATVPWRPLRAVSGETAEKAGLAFVVDQSRALEALPVRWLSPGWFTSRGNDPRVFFNEVAADLERLRQIEHRDLLLFNVERLEAKLAILLGLLRHARRLAENAAKAKAALIAQRAGQTLRSGVDTTKKTDELSRQLRANLNKVRAEAKEAEFAAAKARRAGDVEAQETQIRHSLRLAARSRFIERQIARVAEKQSYRPTRTLRYLFQAEGLRTQPLAYHPWQPEPAAPAEAAVTRANLALIRKRLSPE